MDYDYIEEYVEVAADIFQTKEEYEANMEFDGERDNQLTDGN